MPATVKVNAANTSYDIKIRRGIIEKLGLEVLRINEEIYNEILLITDEKVSALYLDNVIMNFHECPKNEGTKLRICELLIDSSEGAKNFHTISKLLEEMAELGLSKQCCVVALGGGVVCDAAGFAAGCYMGGLKLVLVPTTLAAMIESSVGKSAFLNLAAGKNLAGMPCTPSLVLCDIESLRTLPPDEYKSGIAEIFKSSIMCGDELFKIFERGTVSLNLEKIIGDCIKFRAGFAGSKCLGYEIGNAIESLSNYEIHHGSALSEGIEILTKSSAKMGWCSSDTAGRIISAMKKNDLLINHRSFNADLISHAVLNGSRVSDGVIELAVPAEIGKCEIKSIKSEELEAIIFSGMSA